MNRTTAILTLTLLAGSALAQGNRLPPPPPPSTSATEFDRLENLPAFLRAYSRAGNPRFLVAADAGAGDAAQVGERLGARLEEFFRAPEVELVNPDATAIATRDQVRALARNEEFAAARMLGESVKADLVLFVRMTPKGQNRYAASYVVADLRRGTTLGRHSWDLVPEDGANELTTPRLGEYARAIARRAAAQYIEAYPESGGLANMRRYSVRLVGDYEDDDISAFRDALRSIPGVKADSVMTRGEDKSSAQSTIAFEMFYAGDLLDLRADARRAAVDRLAMEAQVLDSKDSAVTLRLNPLALNARERMLSGGPETPRNKDERAKLLAGYAKAGSPSIAFSINQAVVADEEPLTTDPTLVGGDGALQQGDGVNIIIGDRFNLGTGLVGGNTLGEKIIDRELRDIRKERRQDAVIDTMFFENKMVERFVQLRLTPRDVSGAQVELTKESAGKTWNDRELAFSLAEKSKADVVVSGVGRLVRDRATQQPVRVVFTMRAYRVADGAIIGATSVSRDVRAGDEAFNQYLDELSAEATGKLAAQMSDVWQGVVTPPTTVKVKVETTKTETKTEVTTEVTKPGP